MKIYNVLTLNRGLFKSGINNILNFLLHRILPYFLSNNLNGLGKIYKRKLLNSIKFEIFWRIFNFMMQKLLGRFIFLSVLIICLVNIIWLVSIPGENQNGIFLGFSLERLLLMTVIIFPVIILIFGVALLKK